ncbi:MAG: histidine kinase [Paraglaciecola sp.]|uniref:histidine kinase dimerization/phospho-acceptor domain-containing protein n=1 Tax=Pseudomonadati TaxID=3379134 RepID=UPI00273DA405|nr:histidine kinase dimerization/phospho-acceptor domain-containing protein [Paraglaciecola sp.]MDP5029584.1 histidine kinase [Paraglaciecola sp.]MDP5130388.1 histidine kinase [Paraglaciecola sp.]
MDRIDETEFKDFTHRLRNPLNSISLHAELGKMLIANQGSSEKIAQAFEVILQQCKRCEQTISDMRSNKVSPKSD